MWTHVVWTWNCSKNLQLMSVGLAWKSAAKIFRTISGSQIGSQLLQNMEIIKQTDVLLWKIWRKFGSVSYLFSCNNELYVLTLECRVLIPTQQRPDHHRYLHPCILRIWWSIGLWNQLWVFCPQIHQKSLFRLSHYYFQILLEELWVDLNHDPSKP